MMSLDTLIEAAKYLETIEKGGTVDRRSTSMATKSSSNPHLIHSMINPPFFFSTLIDISNDGSPKSTINGGNIDSIGQAGHLRVDPNLPISFQFHTYSSASLPPSSQRPSSQTGPSKLLSIPSSDRFQSTNRKNSVLVGHSSRLVSPLGSNQMMIITPGSSNASGLNPLGRSPSSGGRGRGNRCRNSSSDDKDHLASNRHRELHKTLEKNRRAHLRSCFEQLKQELPRSEYSDKKTSHINIIHCAMKYINQLKRTEWEYEHEIERLARNKIRFQNQLAQLKEDVLHEASEKHTHLDIDGLLREAAERVVNGAADGGAGYITSGIMSGLIKTPIVQGLKPCDGEEDDHSDGDVIVELAEEYDDETTTTASGIY